MANRERGELELVTPDQTYRLRVTTNACCELEDRSGKSFEDHVTLWNKQRRVSSFRWLVWVALQDQHATVAKTPEAVGLIIDACGPDQLIALMTAFIQLNLDEVKALVEEGWLRPPDHKTEGRADPLVAQAEAAGVDSTSMLVGSV